MKHRGFLRLLIIPLLGKHSVDREEWDCQKCYDFGGIYNLHIGQWLMGIPLEWYYAQTNLKFFKIYNFAAGGDPRDEPKVYKINKEKGNVPPREILLPARTVSVFFGALCCVAIFLIGYYSLNLWVGLIAAIFLMLNQLFISFATRAMTDIYFNFFLLCAYLFIIRFKVLAPKGSYRMLSLIVGIFAGLATSVKISGIVIIGIVFVSFLAYIYFIQSKPRKSILMDLAIFFCAAIAVVYLFNPYFWDLRHPLKFFEMFPARRNLLEFQASLVGTSFHGHDRFFAISLALLGYYSNDFGRSLIYSFFVAIFFYGIIVTNAFIVIKSLFKRVFNVRAIVFIFFLMNYWFILKFMIINWDRYYLPAVIVAELITAVFIYDTLGFFFRMVAKVFGSIRD